jgi:hypothetical protein
VKNGKWGNTESLLFGFYLYIVKKRSSFSFITFQFSILLGKNTNFTPLFSIEKCLREAEKNYF